VNLRAYLDTNVFVYGLLEECNSSIILSTCFSFSTGFLFEKKKKCKESFTKEIIYFIYNEKDNRYS
jgi:hypothetical protein